MGEYGDSDEHLSELIEMTRADANWAARDANQFCNRLDQLAEHPRWKDRIEGEPKTWDRFCNEVLGWPIDFITVIRQGLRILDEADAEKPNLGEALSAGELVAERAEHPGTINPNGVKDHDISCNNVTGDIMQRGNNADYLTARIARDRPDILARMKAGEFRSVRAAARAAEIVRRTFVVDADRPEVAAKKLKKHFQGDRLEALIRELKDGHEGD
jgi:hypothetical protein